jgi:hypothetical protein
MIQLIFINYNEPKSTPIIYSFKLTKPITQIVN